MPTLGSAPPKPRLSRGSYLEARKIPRCVWGRGGGIFPSQPAGGTQSEFGVRFGGELVSAGGVGVLIWELLGCF